MRFIIALLLVFSIPGLTAWAIESNELPFGAYHYEGTYDETFHHRLDTLCFNYFAEYSSVMDGDKIDGLFEHGIQSIRGGIFPGAGDAEAPMKYSWSNYAVIPVRYPYPNPEVKMMGFGGYFDNSGDSMWVSSRGSVDTLSGISTYASEFTDAFPNDYHNRVAFFSRYFFAFPATGLIIYRPDVYIAIDSIGDPSAVVCTVRVSLGESSTCRMAVIKEYAVTAGECSTSVKRMIGPIFSVPDSIIVREIRNGSCGLDTTYHYPDSIRFAPYLNLSIVTTGLRQVRIDKILISDDPGRQLVEPPHLYDSDIRQKFQQYGPQSEKIYAWFLMDEPLYANFMPFKYIKDLMQDSFPNWQIYTENHMVNRGAQSITRSWLKVTGEDHVTPNLYFFGVGNPYAGDSFQYIYEPSPLTRCNAFLSWVRADVDEEQKDFWIILQAHESENWGQRMPTASELSCQTFMSLAWGAKGINYYMYKWPDYGDGIIDASGNPTHLYDEFVDNLGPYIQAVDEFYMPLRWERCYPYKPDHGLTPPSGAYVNSLHGWSDSTNPDTGWAQIGEFHNDSTGDKYIMLVNRACSSDNNGTEAPDQHFTLRLNPNTLNLGDYVYIIDLAATVHKDCDTCDWEGTQDTTYTSAMPGGLIPFTTTLKAGEGKLLKITKAGPHKRGKR